MSTRLQKYIADCGLMSRRAAEKEIEAGNVKVNGVTAKIGDSVNDGDKVTLGGAPVKKKGKKLYYILNKPQGYVTTMSDEFGRKTVAELLPATAERLYPVGRLDKDSEGLLICTNDGDLANKLMHPSYRLKKTYLVNCRGNVYGDQADRLRAMRSLDGQPIAPVDVEIVSRSENGSVLRFILSEGKNRQIRRMCEEAGVSIMQLKRVSIGPIRLDSLAAGQCKQLTPEQLEELKNALEKKISARAAFAKREAAKKTSNVRKTLGKADTKQSNKADASKKVREGTFKRTSSSFSSAKTASDKPARKKFRSPKAD